MVNDRYLIQNCKKYHFSSDYVCSKALTLSKGRCGLCPLLGGDVQALGMSCRIRVSLFTKRPWAAQNSVIISFIFEALGHVASGRPPGGLWTKRSATWTVIHVYVIKPCGWQCVLCCYNIVLQEVLILPTSTKGKDYQKL